MNHAALEARAWSLFAGSVFALMGVSLAGDAESHAASACQWGGADPAAAGSLARAYRAAGAAFVALGALSAAAWRAPAVDASWRLPGGALFVTLGLGAAALRIGDWSRARLPGGLESDSLVEAPALSFGRRCAFWAHWLLASELVAFGSYLLSLLGRKP